MSALLLVEDDPILGRSLTVTLELEGYRVIWVRDLRSAHIASTQPHHSLIILDVNLPDGSGLELCTALRKQGSNIPIIFLTAKSDEDSVVEGFSAGANDYVKKPFSNREFLARVRASLREPARRSSQLHFGDILVSFDQRKVFFKEREIDYNRREFDILSILVRHSESVVTRENLLSSLDKEGEIFDRTIDSHISHIRSKLKKAGVENVQISSVYGVGYRLEKK